MASTDAIAQLIGEREFTAQVHEGNKDSLHISLVNAKMILMVLFDERSSLGLVRLRVRKATEDLVPVFEQADYLHGAGNDAGPSVAGDGGGLCVREEQPARYLFWLG